MRMIGTFIAAVLVALVLPSQALAQSGPSTLRVEVKDSTDLGLPHAEIVLVDNMSLADIRPAVARARGRAKVEISGGVTLERIPELAGTGADYVSVGALTHSAPAADLSFELEPDA